MAQSQGKTTAEVEQEFFEHIRPSSLLRRFAKSEEVAAMVAYVCSPLASATNGAALRVDGGVVRSVSDPRPNLLVREPCRVFCTF